LNNNLNKLISMIFAEFIIIKYTNN
jgi:hypothetical protein